MRRLLYMTALAILFLVASGAHAQQGVAPNQPKIGIKVDRDTLVQGEPFELTINISTQSAVDPVVRLPQFGALRVLRQSESHPMSFSFSFGTGQKNQRFSKHESIYTFLLVADRPGKYQLNPTIVEVDGKRFKSQAYNLNILPSGSSPGAAGQALSQTDPKNQTPQAPSAPDATVKEIDPGAVDPNYFLHMELSDSEVTVGQMVILTVYLYTTWNVGGIHLIREPGTEGFWAETIDTGGSNRHNQTQVTVGGTTYDRVSLRKLALFPIKTGEITIAPSIAQIEVRRGGLFSKRKKVKRSSQPLTLDVLPLPEKDRPDGFNTANVGRYNYRAALDRTDARVGEPVTLTMTARGSGNIRNLILPQLKDVPGFKVYAPETEVNVNARANNVTGSRSSKILMIPKKPGVYVIPGLNWSYFDPASQKYKTLKGSAGKITVKPGENSTGGAGGTVESDPGTGDGSFDRLNRKLRSITTRADLQGGSDGITLNRPWFLFLVVLAPFAWIMIAVVSRTRRKMAENKLKGRSKKADAMARQALTHLSLGTDSMPSEEFFAEIQRIIVGFLENRLETAVAGDTMSELDARLVDRGFNEEHAARIVSEIEGCEFARFARGASAPEERRKALKRVENLVDDLGAVRVTPEKKDGA